jgi:hypothetical protein
MRKFLPAVLLAVLPAALAVGCSRQPQPHIGEWEAQSYSATRQIEGNGSFYFSEDGIVQIESSTSPPIVWNGKYRFDYSKNPITLDIEWKKGQTAVIPVHGIAQFVGKEKEKMQFVYSTKERPSSFQADEPSIWLTKKVKK